MKSFLKKTVRRAKPLLGTFVEITVLGSCENDLHQAVNRAFEMVQLIHQKMNVHDEKSDVSRINRISGPTPIRVHPLTMKVLKEAQTLSCLSQGAFDCSVASYLEQWGYYGPKGAEEKKKLKHCLSPRPSFRSLHFFSKDKIFITHPYLRLDLSGIAKGFAVDCAVQVLKNCGVSSGLVNAGGDLRAFGSESFWIHIRDPNSPGGSIMSLSLKEKALSNSGTYFNRKEYCGRVIHHLVDPFRETSCEHFCAAGVLADSCLLADALTKVLMVRGEEARGLFQVLNAHGYGIARRGKEISWVGSLGDERFS